ncbi:MAG: hypothetical protein NXI32_13890 [bacterium]|nr:hypothetical protein [bacterium]
MKGSSDAPARSLTSTITGSGWMRWLLLACSLMIMTWSFLQMFSAQRHLRQTQQATEQCQQTGEQIRRLASKPTIAATALESSQELLLSITAAITSVDIQADKLVSVSPGEILRLGNSNFQQRATQLLLRDIELSKLAAFYNALTDRNGLCLSGVTLTPAADSPNASNTGESWNARLTLTEIIYSPTSP